MASVRPFHRYRGESSFTTTEFIAILREQLQHVAPAQTKYRVTAVPSERTIRFYTTKKLVDKPIVGCGKQARYGYRHLLQVMAIKYLQSQYLPLVKVRSLVESLSNRDLEHILPETATATAAHRGITRVDRQPVDNSLYQQPLAFDPRPPQESVPAETDQGPAAADTWRRIEVWPGIELHVHTAALSDTDVEHVRGALLRELAVLRGWFGEGKK